MCSEQNSRRGPYLGDLLEGQDLHIPSSVCTRADVLDRGCAHKALLGDANTGDVRASDGEVRIGLRYMIPHDGCFSPKGDGCRTRGCQDAADRSVGNVCNVVEEAGRKSERDQSNKGIVTLICLERSLALPQPEVVMLAESRIRWLGRGKDRADTKAILSQILFSLNGAGGSKPHFHGRSAPMVEVIEGGTKILDGSCGM